MDLPEVWRARGLLYFLVWRDVKVRYKQTVLGGFWVILQPALMVFVFTLFFGHASGIASGPVPYVAFATAGVVLWTAFASGLSAAAMSVVEQQSMISKVYFPRVILPAAPLLAATLDLMIATPLIAVVLLVLGLAIPLQVLLAPLFALMLLLSALGLGLWTAALNARYRDVRYVIPFFIQILLFASPVVYGAEVIPEGLRALYFLNPLAGALEGWRWAWLGTPFPGGYLLVSFSALGVLLLSGFLYFRAVERDIADVV